jgi:PAS domain S-box-containing protein
MSSILPEFLLISKLNAGVDPASRWPVLALDGLIALSCLVVLAGLVVLLARARRDIPLHWTLVAFGVFILACGAAFGIEICNLWNAPAWFTIAVKSVAATAGIVIAAAVPQLVSKVSAFAMAFRATEDRVRQLQIRAAELLSINEFLEAEAAAAGMAAGHLFQSKDRAGDDTVEPLSPVAEATPVGIFHADLEGKLRAVNEAWCQITGLGAQESLRQGWQVGAHPQDIDRINESWANGMGRSAPFSCECRFVLPDGSIRWVIWKSQAEFNGTGKRIGFMGTVVDISERKAIEESLMRSTAEARSINDELSFYKFALDEAAIVAVTDAAGTISFVNDKFCQISGYEREELLGQNHRLLNSSYHPKSFFTAMYAQIGRGHIWRGEIRNRTKSGQYYWVDTTIIPTKAADGRVNRYVAIRSDITERKNAETALAKERLAVERANHALADKNKQLSELYLTAQRFMDDVSHEFRTPLSVIKGYSELMRAGMAGEQSPEQKRFSQIIIDRARDMAQMVDDLLDSSKLRAGSLRVDRKPCHVSDIIAGLQSLVSSRAAASKIEIVEQIDPDLPRVFADAEKAIRVLVNLVVNAIKFSPEGSRIILSATSQDGGDVLISVADQGPGISPENLALIFDRFRQVGNAMGSTKGFGLGLNIAKELVALNLGRMSVRSELKKGSTFSFTLPANQPEIILARLLTHLENLNTAAGAFAVLRVTPAGTNAKDAALEQLRGFLACSSHASDVIMTTADRSALILFGYSAKPGVWLRRLAKVGKDIEQFNPGQKLCAFEIELLDTMPYPTALNLALPTLLKHLETECVHA